MGIEQTLQRMDSSAEQKMTIDSYMPGAVVLYTPPAFKPSSINPPFFRPVDYRYGPSGGSSQINPELDGGVRIKLKTTTPNTSILREDIGPIANTYFHHDHGDGRMETKTDLEKFLERIGSNIDLEKVRRMLGK